MKNRNHLVIIAFILFLTTYVKKLLNALKLNEEDQEAIESLWIICLTSYLLFIMYNLYKKYPKIFNPDYEKQKAYNEKKNITIKNLNNNLSNNFKKLKVIDISKIENYIQINEKKIIAYDRKCLEDLLKLNNHLREAKNIIEYRIQEINEDLKSNSFEYGKIVKELNNSNQNINDLYRIAFTMIDYLINENYTEYQILHQKLNNLGIFNTNFEKEINKKLIYFSSELHSIKSSISYTNTLLTCKYQTN